MSRNILKFNSTSIFWITAGIVFAVALSNAGCAYFNTFYNTKKAFEEGERALRNKLEGEITRSDMMKFDVCIKKGSKLLEVYPGSKYVDDTLYLMGKSFYYKREYVDAIRKFEELQTVFPDSKFISESMLWWGKALIRLEDYDDATAKLNEMLTTKGVKKKMRNEALLEIAGMSFRQENYNEAVEAYRELSTMIDDKEVLARVWLQMGFAYYRTEQYKEAAESFLNTLKYKPTIRERYQAQFNAGISYKLDSRFEKSRSIFNDLMSDGKNSEYFPEIRLELTDCLTCEGKIEESIEEFKDIAAFYPRTVASTRAYGLIGQIYYNMHDYPRASAAFDSSLKGVRDSVTTEIITPLSQYLRALETYHTSIDTSLEQLEKLKDKEDSSDEPASDDSVAADSEKNPSGKIMTAEEIHREKQLQEDSFAKHFYLAGELFLYKIDVPDSAEIYFQYIIDNFKHSSYTPRSLLLLGHIYRDEEKDTTKANELFKRIVDEYSNDEFVNIARKELGMEAVSILHDSLNALFMKAESLFFDVQDYEKAIEYYSIICNSFPNSEIAPKSRYIIGWYYENALFDIDLALDEYEKFLDDYPSSPLYRLIDNKVKAAIQRKENPPKDDKKDDKDKRKGRRNRRR